MPLSLGNILMPPIFFCIKKKERQPMKIVCLLKSAAKSMKLLRSRGSNASKEYRVVIARTKSTSTQETFCQKKSC